MIQKTNPRHGNTAVAPIRVPAPGGPERWGSWSGRKYYALEVVQNPLRARMCGFGDKDRRPLAPAAVCKMIVTRDDNTIVEDDDIDIAFLIVTVDLWSEDGKQEMNLVLHPSSQDRIINSYLAHPAKVRRRGSGAASAPSSRPHHQSPETSQATTSSQYAMRSGDPQPNTVTPIVPSQAPQFGQQSYSFPLQSSPLQEHMGFQQAPPYTTHQETPAWDYAPQSHPQSFDRSGNSGYTPGLHAERNATPVAGPSEPWHDNNVNMPASTYRPWSGDTYSNMVPGTPAPQTNTPYNNNADIDPSLRQAQVTHSSPPHSSWGHPAMPSAADPSSNTRYEQEQFAGTGSSTQFDGSATYTPVSNTQHASPFYPNSNYVQSSTPPPSNHPASPRQTYTRTLVGPLSANACRLKDEHRKPGIFFLFQDLSVRTEGTFRLRLRLMNVGAPAVPDARSLRTHTDVSPVLAQTFTEPFMVYSAKRFPGVPDTTALSISFGSQGQKLPLRNRHGKQSRKRRRSEDFDGSDEDEDGEGT